MLSLGRARSVTPRCPRDGTLAGGGSSQVQRSIGGTLSRSGKHYMARHAWWLIAVVLMTGCVPAPSPKSKKSSLSTTSKKTVAEDDSRDPSPAPPEKKVEPKPGQVFTP